MGKKLAQFTISMEIMTAGHELYQKKNWFGLINGFIRTRKSI